MRVSKEKAAENRQALLQAASRLFREKGIDGVGVAEVARQAGLTHGALYAHFDSKDALAAEAFSEGFAAVKKSVVAWKGDGNPPFEAYLDILFSESARDRLAAGCPMTASASEASRQGPAVSASFTRAFAEMVGIFEGSLTAIPVAQRRRLAIAAATAQIGAVAVSRAIAKTDAQLSAEVLKSMVDTLAAAHLAVAQGE